MCLFRNQGIYILILTFLVVVIIYRKYLNKVLLMFVTPILIVLLISGPLFNVLNIKPANPREALSLPLQQIARIENLHSNEITDDLKKEINKYIPQENIDQYNPWTSDYVKEGFNQQEFKSNPFHFFELWFKFLSYDPSGAFDSFLYGSYGYFYCDQDPFWMTYILYDGAWLDNGNNILDIQRSSLFPLYDNYLRHTSSQLMDKIPFVSVILNQAFPFLLLIFIVGSILYDRKYRLVIPCIFLLLFWLTILIGPLIAIRYAFPLIVCVPTIFALFFYSSKTEIIESI